MAEVIFKVENKVAHIILNRPEKINTLTHEMIVAIDLKMQEWQDDEDIICVVMCGAGNRGFSAGGDMKIYYENKAEAHQLARRFFPTEYELDYKIINYPKPIIAFLDGIVMGGGVGLSYGADYKLVTPTTKWAMPEVSIGFFPDVGGTYFLNQIPKEIALYITFLAKFLKADDVLYLGYGTHKINQEDFQNILIELSQIEGKDAKTEIASILDKYKQNPLPSYLEEHKELIKKYFKANSVEEIIIKLQEGAEKEDPWARATLEEMRKKSLLSQYVIFEQLKRGENLSLEECFALEEKLSLNFMDNPDFYEGLRSVLVDKNEPNWHYQEVEDISEELVEKFFL